MHKDHLVNTNFFVNDCETSHSANENNTQICSCNQPVLSNAGKVSRKEWEPWIGFELTPDYKSDDVCTRCCSCTDHLQAYIVANLNDK